MSDNTTHVSETEKRTREEQKTGQQKRFGVAVLLWFVLTMLCIWKADIFNVLGWIGIGLIAGAVVGYFLAVMVPEVTGVVFLNLVTSEMKPFGAGIRFKYPWESLRRIVSLKLVTERHKETYAAHDGPFLLTKWSYQYEPRLGQLGAFIAVDKTTIDDGFTDVISSILSDIIGNAAEHFPDDIGDEDKKAAKGHESEWMREHVEFIELGVLQKLHERKVFEEGKSRNNNEEGLQPDDQPKKVKSMRDKLEETYGVNFKLFSLADIDFDEEYQEARGGQARMNVVIEAARKLEGLSADATPSKEAIKMVLAERGKAKLSIVDNWGNADPLQRAASTIGSMLGGGS
jgi:hypothetical protein